MSRKKRRITITTSEALRRLDKMSPIIFRNVQNAIWIEATMEAGNDIVGSMPNRSFPGAGAYNRIMKSLAYDLAMHLARLYDIGARHRRPNEKDIASIPLAVRLLRQRRCKRVLCLRARDWITYDASLNDVFENSCLQAIEQASEIYSRAVSGSIGRDGLRILKEFRDNFVAHSLMNEADANPLYHHLFYLTDCARDFVEHARLAIEGKDEDLRKHEAIFVDDARRFWRMALLGERDEMKAISSQMEAGE